MSPELKKYPYSSLEVPGWGRGPSEVSQPGTRRGALKSFGSSHDGYLPIRFQGIYLTPPELREKLTGTVSHILTEFCTEDSSFAFWTRTQSPVRHTLARVAGIS